MKQEATKKPKKLLWLWIVLAALVVIAGVAVALIFGLGNQEPAGPVGGRPDLYWNLDKAVYTEGSASGLSTREPGEDGIYRVRFAYNGQQLELPIADKQLVNVIDTLDVMGIVQDADGTVIDVIAPEDFVTPVALNAYVQQVTGDKIIANSSIAMNGMQYQIELCDLTEIYDVSDTAEVAGQIIEASAFQPMDSIWVYANDLEEITHIYMTDHPETSPVYWRAYQMWNSSEKSTSRVPDENGVYSIDFCSDGGIVTLKCKDKSIVTSIDNKSPHSCHFGFIFDEEGYIIEIMNSGIGIRGAVAAERIEVTELDGNYFSGTQLIPSDGGLSYSATLPEGCLIYDASSSATREGRQGQQVDSLKLGDRICVWTDPTGNPVMVYIANRLVDYPAYFNLVRSYDATKKETKREPVNGYYEFEMVETGKTGKQTLKTADKELANFIDSIANRVVGLQVEGNIIKNAYKDDDVFGWTSIYGGYVPQIQGSIVSLVSFSKPDSPSNVLMKADFKCYDVSGKDVPYGTETTLRVGDMATVTRDVSYNGVVIYITRRTVGGDSVYYNLDYQYNSTTKQTKRVPDENGWYYFTMAHKGKQVTVKTNKKEFADLIDKSPNGDLVVVMRVEGGIVKEVYETPAAYGQILRSGYRVTAVNSDGSYTVVASTGVEYTLKMADDCVIYNVSTVYDSYRGERTYSLKVGDMVSSLADYRSNVKLIYVRQRCVDYMYVNQKQMYDSSKKVTLREPDADGWYWFDLAVNGEVKKFKTKDVELASKIDAYTTPFGLRVKGDEILNVTGPTYVGSIRSIAANGWTVTSVSKWSMDLRYDKPGSNEGKTLNVNLASGMKVYDISPTAKNFGEAVTLKKGDTVLAYANLDKNVVLCYVLFHDSRVKGAVGYCEHCEKEVKWLPWAGGSWAQYDAHYYLAGDVQYSAQSNIGNQTKNYEIVLDLNGKTYNAVGSRGALIRYEDALSIIDSVGGGVFAGTGINGNGGTFLMSSGGILNLYSGTLSFIDSENASVKNGSVIYADSSVINIYGGAISGGISNLSETNVAYIDSVTTNPDKRDYNILGGNVHIRNTVFNMYGGVIENGQAIRTLGLKPTPAAQGGNLYAAKNSVINLYEGAEIRGGYSNQHGGNVFITTSTLNMLGGKIYGGECLYSGGNIYNQFGGVVNMEKGTVENGTADAAGNNYYGSHDTGVLNLTGGTITGDITIGKGASVTVSGTPKVTVGEKCGLSVPTSLPVTLGALSDGAEVYVNARGAFTVENAKAQAYANAGYIKAAAPRTNVVVKDNVMYMEGEQSFCEHCYETVTWYEWPGTTNPESGHYFIGSDFKQSSQISIAADTDVVLDLYGNTYSSEKIRNFLVRGTLSIMDSSAEGTGVMVTTGGEEFAGAIALVGTIAGSEKPSGFNLYSGTLKLADDHAVFANGGLIAFNGGELNMYGGKMIGGNVTMRGGCVTVPSANSVMNVFGGEITGGTADIAGGCLYIAGAVNIVGGTIDGQVYVDKGAEAFIAGTPVIGELGLYSGVLADISGLAEGADIGIDAEGIFTTELETPTDYIPYLHTTDSNKDIRSTGTALQMTLGQGYFDQVNAIHEEAEKMTADGVFAAGGAVTATCPVCEQEVQWNDLNALETTFISEDGHYYLSADLNNLTTHYSINSNANVCLHLNGKNITSSARAIYVDATSTTLATLNIMGEGTVTGAGVDNASVPRGVVDVGGTVNFYGGTFVATGSNPAVTARGYLGRSIVNIYDAAEFTAPNVSILVRSQAVNMYGGSVTAGSVKLDGAASNELNVYGGTIENANNGQFAITAAGEKASLNITGGTVGTVSVASTLKSLSVSGKPVIECLDIVSGMLANIYGLEDGAKIGVIADGAFTVSNPEANTFLQEEYVVPATDGLLLTEEDGVLYMEAEKIFCEHCEMEVVWKQWPGHSSPVSGHYYIDDDYTQPGQFSIVNDTDVVIDLRGRTYSSTKIRNFLVRGKLSIMDTVGGGQMVTTCGKSYAGGIALVGKDGSTTGTPTFNVYGGTLKLDTQNADFETFANAGLVWANGAVEMNVYGGTLIGGYVSEYGGAIKAENGATLNVYDGTINGGTAGINGGCVAVVNAKLNMMGGNVDGDVYIDAQSVNVAISGAAKIKELVITEGVLVDVSGLTDGAQIGVKANGVFTKPLTNANDYLNYFTNKDFISVDNDALVIMDAIDIANAVHTVAEKMTADGVFNAGGTISAVCPVCGTEEQWEDLAQIAPSTLTTDKHYYLSKDLNTTKLYNFTSNCCLHLNGHNITSTVRAIYSEGIYDRASASYTIYTLNIMGEGIVSGGGVNHATLPKGTIDIGGNVNFYGGTFVASGNNPALCARGFNGRSVVNIYDGTEFVAPNISLFVQSQAVNMYGGKITSGTVKTPGTAACSFNVYGGSIANSNAEQNAVDAAGSKASVTIAGGTINGKVNVAADLKEIIVSGAPVIENLDVSSGKKLAVGELEQGAKITVSATGAFADALTNAADLVKFFKAYEDGYMVAAQGDSLAVCEDPTAKLNNIHTLAEKMTDDGIFSAGGDVIANCPVCETEVTWKELNTIPTDSGKTTTTLAAGHYYLSNDVNKSGHYSVSSGKYCFHLNDNDIISTARAIVVNSGTLNIMGKGHVSGSGNYNGTLKAYCGVLDVVGAANLYGGTYTSNNEAGAVVVRGNAATNFVNMYEGASIVRNTEKPGIAVRIFDDGDFNMYGGLVSGGTGTGEFGGNFTLQPSKVTSRTTVLNIYGGTVENGTADKGGNVYAYGATAVVGIFGGNINNGDVYIADTVKSVTVSGAPVVATLNLESGKKLTLGDLEDGASITVTAPNGAFTDASAAAAYYVDFFHAATGKKVEAENNTLVMKDA